jgi:hypothetical protein
MATIRMATIAMYLPMPSSVSLVSVPVVMLSFVLQPKKKTGREMSAHRYEK